MIKYTTILLCIFMAACNDESQYNENILISGQSNAIKCDWDYFEKVSGYGLINIAVGGCDIECLIEDALDNQYSELPVTMIFVHGESDAKYNHDGDWYVSKVNEYINILGVNKVYISLVGYRVVNGYYGDADQDEMDRRFDVIRDAVVSEIKSNDLWHTGFSEAMYFRDWDMLDDHIHFRQSGCKLMIESIIDSMHHR